MDCIKKIFKVIGIIAAIAAAVAGVYYAVAKIKAKKDEGENAEDCYVSCSCCDNEA